MEKIVEELDIKGLEEEIDSAVERLFVDKNKAADVAPQTANEKLSPLSEGAKTFDVEEDLAKLSLELSAAPAAQPLKELEAKEPPPSIPKATPKPTPKPTQELPPQMISKEPEPSLVSVAPPEAPSQMASLEKMETHLLSLEWEITKENLERTKREVVALRGVFKDKPDVSSVLNLMEKVLAYMGKGEEGIRPPIIKFLLDATETMKLLMNGDNGKESRAYKQLLCGGLQARFMSLEGMSDKKTIEPPSASADGSEMMNRKAEEVEKMLNRMTLLCEKLEGALKKLERAPGAVERVPDRVAPAAVERAPDRVIPDAFEGVHERVAPVAVQRGPGRVAPAAVQRAVERMAPPPLREETPPSMNVTIFRIGERLFGIESPKVFKLFKVPESFRSRYSKNERIRLKDLEMRLIDLTKVFAISGGETRGEMRILAVKDGAELKGFIIDQVLQQFSAGSQFKPLGGDYFIGVVHWPYQKQVVDVPVLNVKRV